MVATIEARDVIRVTGDDAATYLQGQASQDIERIEVGGSAWSLVLDPTGKLVSWFRIHRIADTEFLLDLEPGAAEATIARLERFKLRTKVDFVQEHGWRVASVRHGAMPPGGDLVAEVSWPGWAGTDVLLAPATPDPDLDCDAAAFEESRIRAGVPRLGVDLTVDTIPAEGGAPLIEAAVSFTKGCYTGQELVARIDSRGGNVPRPVRVLTSEAPLAVGAGVVLDGQEIGRVTSAAGSVALAPILRKAETGSTVEVGGIAATVGATPR
jgi:folate-binding protein YgfZ